MTADVMTTGPRLAPLTYVERVAEIVPSTTPALAREDALFLCERILSGGQGAATAAELVRAHFADRAALDDHQVTTLLRAALSDAGPGNGRLERPA